MKFIKDIHDLVNFLAGKNIASKYAPEKIDLVIHEVSQSMFTDYHDHYAKNEKIARIMDVFKRTAEITISNGIGELPPDFAFNREMYLTSGVAIDLVEDNFWAKRVSRKLAGPSLTNPIARIEAQLDESMKVEVSVGGETLPDGKIVAHYFRYPIKPEYKYTVSGTRYVYNDGASTDVDWPVVMFPVLKAKVLSALGINLRESQLIQYSELMKSQEGTK